MIGWHAVYLGHGLGGLVNFSMTIVESRGFGKGQYTNGEDSGRYKGESKGDLPGRGFTRLVALRSVVEDGGEEDAERDEELVGGNQSSTNMSRCCLRLAPVSSGYTLSEG